MPQWFTDFLDSGDLHRGLGPAEPWQGDPETRVGSDDAIRESSTEHRPDDLEPVLIVGFPKKFKNLRE